MKKIKTLLISLLSLSFVLASCEGPSGPPGRDGTNGLNGNNSTSNAIFEIDDADFNAANNFTIGGVIPEEISIFPSDLVLVYRRNGTDTTIDGEEIDIWELLPQNFFFEQGTFLYTFNHTQENFEIVIDSNFDLNELTESQNTNFLNDQIFRIAIVAAANINDTNTSAKALDYQKIAENAALINFE